MASVINHLIFLPVVKKLKFPPYVNITLSTTGNMPIGPVRRKRITGSSREKRNYDDFGVSESPIKREANELAILSFVLHGLGSTHKHVKIIIQDTILLNTTSMLLERYGDYIETVTIVEKFQDYGDLIRNNVAIRGWGKKVTVVCDNMVDFMSGENVLYDFIWFDGQKTRIEPADIKQLTRALLYAQCFVLTLTNRGRVKGGGLNSWVRIQRLVKLIEPLSGNKTLDHGYHSSMNMHLLAFGRVKSGCRYRVGSIKPGKTAACASKIRPFGYNIKNRVFTIHENPDVVRNRGWFIV